jgi:hypothetical protein
MSITRARALQLDNCTGPRRRKGEQAHGERGQAADRLAACLVLRARILKEISGDRKGSGRARLDIERGPCGCYDLVQMVVPELWFVCPEFGLDGMPCGASPIDIRVPPLVSWRIITILVVLPEVKVNTVGAEVPDCVCDWP